MSNEPVEQPSEAEVVPIGRLSSYAKACRAWDMRIAGATWRSIAEVLGYSGHSAVQNHVKQYFGNLPEDDKHARRRLEGERLERLWMYAMRNVKDGRKGAISDAVKLSARISQMYGLDAPTRVQVAPEPERVREVVALLQEIKGATPEEEADIMADVVDAEIVEEPEPEPEPAPKVETYDGPDDLNTLVQF